MSKNTKDITKKHNILFLSHERKLGGATISLIEIAKALKEEGHDVHVAVLFHGCPIDKELRKSGIPTVSAFYGWWQMPSYWGLAIGSAFRFLHFCQFIPKIKLINYIRKNNIDVIHSNSSTIDIGIQIKKEFVKKGIDIKHIYHFREFGDTDFNLKYMYGRKKSLDLIDKYADKVIFISKALQTHYSDFTNASKAVVVYNAVNIKDDVINENIIEKKEGRLLFLQTGTISAGKNQQLVLEAVNILKNRNIKNFDVVFAGEASALTSSKEYKNSMIKYIEENALDNVRLLGRVSDMHSLRSKADVEIMPSKGEAFGRVTVEAMNEGLAVIASNAGANEELVINGSNGYIFDLKKPEGLADAMEKCIGDRNSVSLMGQRGKDYAKEYFCIERLIRDLSGIYNE